MATAAPPRAPRATSRSPARRSDPWGPLERSLPAEAAVEYHDARDDYAVGKAESLKRQRPKSYAPISARRGRSEQTWVTAVIADGR